MTGAVEVAFECGSSPLTRGARGHPHWVCGAGGLIPAYAGSTSYADTAGACVWAHPRLRGEHSNRRCNGCATGGSSPLTRGALPAWWARREQRRLIPAYAGSTLGEVSAWSPVWAHPRLRGEHARPFLSVLGKGGSSPLTRGAPRPVEHDDRRLGLIPAYAGSTPACPPTPRTARAHPRLRGEHTQNPPGGHRRGGSSPLTRGAHGRSTMPKKKKRLIPAYAGSTSSSYWASWLAQAHPRLRGEHWPAPPKWLSGMGSSPLTRGARVLHRRRPGTPGLIPAYAGSTMKSPPCWAWLGAHPRLRGEHLTARVFLFH